MFLDRILDRAIRVGRLTVVDAHDRHHVFSGEEGPSVTVRLNSRFLHWRILLCPRLAIGEAYTDGTLTIEDGTVYDLLDLLGRNVERAGFPRLDRVLQRIDRLLKRFHQFNPAGRSRRNVSHHYDLSDTFYDLFLDPRRQYSCAYFRSPDDTLEAAQEQKLRHIAAKLRVSPGDSVLDIGSGWGGLAAYFADRLKAQVTGITLSEEQLKASKKLVASTGLTGRADFHLADYRTLEGTFDRIVSVGMFEHVGVGHFDTYFRVIKDRLADNGIALVHTIGRAEEPGATNPWIRKYIFPGGYIPALSEMVPSIERAGLRITDIEVLRLHYAETLRHWRENFHRNRDRVAALYDERFCRLWEFYLAGSEIAFRYMNCVVFQVQLAKRQDAAPLTRDYISEAERELEMEIANDNDAPREQEKAA